MVKHILCADTFGVRFSSSPLGRVCSGSTNCVVELHAFHSRTVAVYTELCSCGRVYKNDKCGLLLSALSKNMHKVILSYAAHKYSRAIQTYGDAGDCIEPFSVRIWRKGSRCGLKNRWVHPVPVRVRLSALLPPWKLVN